MPAVRRISWILVFTGFWGLGVFFGWFKYSLEGGLEGAQSGLVVRVVEVLAGPVDELEALADDGGVFGKALAGGGAEVEAHQDAAHVAIGLAILFFQRGLQGFLEKGVDGGIGSGEAQEAVADDAFFVGVLEAVLAEVDEGGQACGSLDVQQVTKGERIEMALGVDEVGLEVWHQVQVSMTDEHGDEVPAGLAVQQAAVIQRGRFAQNLIRGGEHIGAVGAGIEAFQNFIEPRDFRAACGVIQHFQQGLLGFRTADLQQHGETAQAKGGRADMIQVGPRQGIGDAAPQLFGPGKGGGLQAKGLAGGEEFSVQSFPQKGGYGGHRLGSEVYEAFEVMH